MSVHALSWAFGVDATPTQKLAMLALANFADADGVCWPAYKRLEAMTGLNRRTLMRCYKELSDKGILAVVVREREDGSRASNIYRFGGGSGDPLNPVQCREVEGGVTVCPPPLSPESPLEPSRNRKEEIHSALKPKTRRTNAELGYTEDFADFWDAYPKKAGKLEAFKEWQELGPPDEEFKAQIMEGLGNYILTLSDMKFCLDPCRFLKRRRWEDGTSNAGPEITPAEEWMKLPYCPG